MNVRIIIAFLACSNIMSNLYSMEQYPEYPEVPPHRIVEIEGKKFQYRPLKMGFVCLECLKTILLDGSDEEAIKRVLLNHIGFSEKKSSSNTIDGAHGLKSNVDFVKMTKNKVICKFCSKQLPLDHQIMMNHLKDIHDIDSELVSVE